MTQRPWTGPLPSFYLAVPPEYFSVKTPGGIPPCRDLGNLFTPNKLKHPRSATWVICSQRTNQISLPEVPGVGHRTIARDLKRLGAMDQCADAPMVSWPDGLVIQ